MPKYSLFLGFSLCCAAFHETLQGFLIGAGCTMPGEGSGVGGCLYSMSCKAQHQELTPLA